MINNLYYNNPKKIDDLKKEKTQIIRFANVIDEYLNYCFSSDEINFICNPADLVEEIIKDRPLRASAYANLGINTLAAASTVSTANIEITEMNEDL